MTELNKFDVNKIRKDFPVLDREVSKGVPLVYLDSTATSQKPVAVIDVMDRYYREYNANIHRGVHRLAEEATAAYEEARHKIARFINAKNAREIIYTRNTTESINLVAYSWGRANLKAGDVIILTEMEHHSNLVPWYILAEGKGVKIEFIPVTEDGLLDINVYKQLLLLNPKLVAFTQMSNVLGTITAAKEMTRMAHAVGALVLIDGAQSVPHLKVDVQDLDADFLAFSAHKMLGPTGIGALYGREKVLDAMPPFMGGGDMIKKVLLGSYTPNELPHKFEAGTPAIAEAIGFGAAVDYLKNIGMENVEAHEREIATYALNMLSDFPGLQVIGPSADKRGGVTSFVMDNIHPHDVAQILDSEGIAVRAGHHCAMPLHEKYRLPATTRASFYVYNTKEEVDKLIIGLKKVRKIFG
ncbi:MAG: cysteine desulfurase [Anaerolineae bacterium]|nr:cysteine desulfurase [Anaerolineae bacterium]